MTDSRSVLAVTSGCGRGALGAGPRRIGLAASAAVALATMLAVAAPAHATLFPAWTTQDLAARADLVAVVTITRVDSRWMRSGRRIATFYEAAVVSIERPSPTPVDVSIPLKFALPGGEVGQWGQHVPGTPRLVVGERAVVFLSPPAGPNGERRVVGLGLGVLRLVAGDQNQPRLVPIVVPGGGAPTPPTTLAELRRTLRRARTGGAQ